MCFGIERIFEDYEHCENLPSHYERMEETTHHPVMAAMIAADMVADGHALLDAAIQLYRDSWYGFDTYHVRFPHFYQMVCHLVK